MSQEWRKHPHLAKRFRWGRPDEVQILAHDGGPRLTLPRPELVWVRVLAVDGDVFEAEVLNDTQQLATVGRGDRVKFVVPASGKHPVMVTFKYLLERPAWTITPCNKCGLSELLDAPSDLIAQLFPDLEEGDGVEVFTSFCGVCGGEQTVQSLGFVSAEAEAQSPTGAARKWWQFWK